MSEPLNKNTPKLSGRELALERRKALSQTGAATVAKSKAAPGRVAPARTPMPAPAPMAAAPARSVVAPQPPATTPVRESSPVTLAPIVSQGRALAQAHREDRCKNGRGDAPSCRPSGRVRAKSDGPHKVEEGTTLSGTLVTGNQVERTIKVTGSEPGSCKVITGTEYIGSEQYQDICGTKPEPAPAKVSTGTTRGGQRVSGTELAQSERVTGSEYGACKRITGVEYLGVEQFESICRTRTDGNGRTAVKPLTAPVNATSLQGDSGPKKVQISRTWQNQAVSGASVERSSKVTGDEYGACEPISGSPYIGAGQYEEFCDANAVAATAGRQASRRSTPGAVLTGIQPGADKLTGAGRGTCQPISGTPYLGADQFSKNCSTTGGSKHPLTLGSARRAQPDTVAGPDAATVAGEFSIVSPQRAAKARSVTGVSDNAAARITGPVNLATGLVSGTPEFRSREEPALAKASAESKTSRVTGEGQEVGFSVTGDDWSRAGAVTGTEGVSARRRNPTLRSTTPSPALGPAGIKPRERPEPPLSKITGSSGNSAAGSTVTYSGGARG